MATYFFRGIEVSVAVSLIVGVIVGAVMGFAGFRSRWLFLTEMLSFLIGGAIVVISQLAFAIVAGASLGRKTALVVVLLFVVAEPVIALLAASTAVAVNYLIRRFAHS
jgi:hypothetical protein